MSHPAKQVRGKRRRLIKLLRRDGFNCHICKKPLNLRAEYNAWDQPSLDHIIPRSEGGSHKLENLKLAHRMCNSVRGSRPLDSLESLE